MGRASERVQIGALFGAALLAVGMVLPLSAPRASAPTDGASLFTPGLGCGPSETLVGTGGLLARVRADAVPARPQDAAKAQPRGGQQAARRRPSAPPLPRSTGKAPQVEQEPRAAVLRSFYTCDATPLRNLTEGTGWRLVGPLRHS